MDESKMCIRMHEPDITALKETLQTQQVLLQQLYNELDEEREASATATSEALSMMLRLQGEKAVVKMEASQYKRMTEEKMYHAEESLAIFEDLVYQKEIEIAALESQVQAYRWKLLSMGCNDLDVGEPRLHENLSHQRSEANVLDKGFQGLYRRSSLPPLWIKDSNHKRSERERSVTPPLPPIPVPDLLPKIVEINTDKESNVHVVDLEKKCENSAVGNFDFYWERIKKLDEQVKEISDCKDLTGKGKSANLKDGARFYSWQSQASIGTLCHSTREHPGNLLETEATASAACSSGIHDIFEVPAYDKNHKSCGWQKKEEGKFFLENENRLGKPESIPKEAAESYVVDETDWVKKMLHCTRNEKKSLKPRDGVAVDNHLGLVHPKSGGLETQAEIHQLSMRLERLENERRTVRQEISTGGEEELALLKEIREQLNSMQSERLERLENERKTVRQEIRSEGEEESELLKEMREQLNSIQSEIRSWRTKKSPPSNEPSLVPVMEAMLHFWL